MAKRNVEDALYKTPAGVVSYDEYMSMPYVNGRQQDETIVLKRNGRTHAGVGAYNHNKANFYRIAVAGRPGCAVFPTDGAKAYYIQCMKNALPLYPVEIESFSIVHNAAYVVIATFDQTPVSYRRYFDLVNVTYARFFGETFGYDGMVFKSKVFVKRLKTMEEVASAIATVDSQPMVRGLGKIGAYRYSTSGEHPDTGITSQGAYADAFGEEGRAQLISAYNGGAGVIDVGSVGREKLDVVIEDTLIDYGCYTKRAIPNDIMHRLIAVIAENSGECYDKICNKLAIPKARRDGLLVYVMGELIIGLKHSFDASYRMLGAESADKRGLMVGLAIHLYDRLGYSIDKIFAMMGFAYCAVIGGRCHYYNEDLVVDIVRKFAEVKGTGVETAINMLGIRDTFEDPERVAYIATVCRGEASID